MDLVAVWEVPLSDGTYRVEFEHGTTTGKRVVRINGQEIVRRDWMFKLVGEECFSAGAAKCIIRIEAFGTFAYQYTLEVNGKSYKKFSENQSKLLHTWTLFVDGAPTRVCLEKDTLDVFVNGQKMNTAGEFVDNGTETHFEFFNHSGTILATSSGKRRKGILYKLFIDGKEIPPENWTN